MRGVYFDETGMRWYGSTCGACQSVNRKELQHAPPPASNSGRCCSVCSKQLPRTRYFKCEACVPVLPSDDFDVYSSATSTVGDGNRWSSRYGENKDNN
jgi:hypothetical protein